MEGISIDEAFLDVGGLHRIAGPPDVIAARLRAAVLSGVGLPITVGVARTKFLAEVASGVAKPDGLLVVPADRELEFLHPLPVERLWGVGDVTAAKLHGLGLPTVGEVAAFDESGLVSLLGRAAGRHLHALAHNHDPRPVETGRRRRSIGSQRALGRRERTHEDLEAILASLVDGISRRLRTAHRACRTVILRLRFADFTRATRSHTVRYPTADTEVLLTAARQLLDTAMPMIRNRGITLLGVSFTNLRSDTPMQMTLPFEEAEPGALDAALDHVRDRFGGASVTRAALLGRDPGISAPLLPD